MENEEIWKDIPGYEGHYQVSNLGNLVSVKKEKRKLILPKLNNKGYYRIILYKEAKEKNFTFHRLVAMSFLENIYDKRFINHIDGVKTNNRVDNLEWCTPRENNIHAYNMGLTKMTFESGIKHRGCKITEDLFLKAKLCKTLGIRHNIVAKELNLSSRTINSIYSDRIKYGFDELNITNAKQRFSEWLIYILNLNHIESDRIYNLNKSRKPPIISGSALNRGHLTEYDIIQIREKRKMGAKTIELAIEFNVTQRNIQHIVSTKSNNTKGWRQVK